jgi:cytochrome c553
MAWSRLPGPRALFYAALILVGGGIVLTLVGILSGAYNVAASAKHFYVTDRLLKIVLYRSVATHSLGVEVPPLDDPGLIRLGARHFVTGCQPCHAGPGIDQSPIAASMYPAAPALSRNVSDWESRELFWIVRHGFKFTGMPHWPGRGRDDEVWAVVAFLEQLPDMSPQEYAELTGMTNAGERGFSLAGSASAADCDSCHGGENEAPVAPLAPSLNGQNAAYLIRALEEYATGNRESGMMEPIATAMATEGRERLAAEYAAMEAPAPYEADADSMASGERIATEGIKHQNIPPCAACHSPGKSDQFPSLEGLSAEYLANQLELFRSGIRSGTPYASIMAPIARRLTDVQIADVAAYFSSLQRDAPADVAEGAEMAR